MGVGEGVTFVHLFWKPTPLGSCRSSWLNNFVGIQWKLINASRVLHPSAIQCRRRFLKMMTKRMVKMIQKKWRLMLTYYGHVNTGSLNSTSHLLWVTCYCTQENTAWDSAQSALVTANFVFYNQLFTICKVGICMIRKQGLSKLT